MEPSPFRAFPVHDELSSVYGARWRHQATKRKKNPPQINRRPGSYSNQLNTLLSPHIANPKAINMAEVHPRPHLGNEFVASFSASQAPPHQVSQ